MGKTLLKSKTFWAALVGLGFAIAGASGINTEWIDMSKFTDAIQFFALIFLRDAIK